MRVSNVTVRKRLIAILVIALGIFFIFIVRLGYIQVFKNGWLSNQALNSWSKLIPYEAERGDILDRNGKVLATNISKPSVLVVPRQVRDPKKTAKKLAEVLGMSEKKAYQDITKKQSKVYITPEGRKISNQKASKIKSFGLPGVFIAEDFKRSYPYGNYLSHVLGFAGIDNQGLTGLEAYYDQQLKGKNGHVAFFSDARGNRMANIKDKYVPPESGNSLKLTIDKRVQSIIERELNLADQKYHPEGAIAIAMNPNNGEILGMSSRPGFNPENYKKVPQEIYNRNLPIWKTYEPGSTFKVITLAAALQENLVDLKNDHFSDPGFIDVNGTKLHCWKRGGHGDETFLEVVQNSCNPGFVKLGQKLGKDRLFSYIKNFGFGQKTGIDLQGEAKGILFNMKNVGPLEQATTAFGQGVAVTPIQQVAAVAAAVNGGYLYEPHIAKGWVDPKTGKEINQTSPIEKRQVISEKTSKEVRYALESVVAQGTGRNAYVQGYRIGGKTGTAQKVKQGGGGYMENNYIVSFMGFAPANDPQIVVYVAIDHPQNTVQFGGTVAAPIAGKIIGDSLSAMGVKKQKGGLQKIAKYPDQPMLKVPNFVGMDREELEAGMLDLKVDVVGKGRYVVMQSPQPGVKLNPGSTIRIYLGDKKEKGD
ncbi:stage V sporulation protein D [Terrilactibacillus laevilacticus]|uniref:serine-type D-Ala-D-Ala carboxypeptidase n=1 Tax=Terrilactibacillus laevilacticus TaxID=1380157 RepID=A0ABW5PQ10_9BACI|nr:stage V sporulation protein D [Terrilactibacillus laevilacticus]